MITPILGDMISLAHEGQFDVIGHGCNCFCAMKRGIAPLMHENFGCNDHEIFKMENLWYSGNMDKLGTYESQRVPRVKGSTEQIIVVNLYTQYHWSEPGSDGIPLDYEALTLCMRKLNKRFPGKEIALPGLIGCGLAGGDSLKVWNIIGKEMKYCDTKIVFLNPDKLPKFLEGAWPNLFL